MGPGRGGESVWTRPAQETGRRQIGGGRECMAGRIKAGRLGLLGVGWWEGKAATALLRLALPSRQGVLQLNLKMLFFTGHVYNKRDMRGIESCIYYLCHCMILFHNYSQYNFTLKSYITKYVGKCLVSCKVALHMLNKFSVELPE